MIWRAPLSYGWTWKVERARKNIKLKNLVLLLAIASSNSYIFIELSQPPVCIHNSTEHAKSWNISLI